MVNPTTLRVWCIRGEGVPGGIRDTWGFRGVVWYFELDARTRETRLAPAQRLTRARPRKPADLPELTPAQLDEALRVIASAFPLTDDHRAMLQARGYDLAACGGMAARHAFASLPADMVARYGVVATLIKRCVWADTAHAWAVPGIERGDGRRRESRDGDTLAFLPGVRGPALMEFRRDANGFFWSFEVAPDAPRDPKRKRVWPLGQRVDRCHVATPRLDKGELVLITEGGHKANLLADAYSAPALATLGKGNWRRSLAALDELYPTRERMVVVALDTDAWDCDGRARASEERLLTQALMVARRRVAVLRWDAMAAKGPDDALMAGLAVTIAPVEVSDDLRRRLERQPRADRRVTHRHAWQRAASDGETRGANLDAISQRIAAAAREHLTASDAAERAAVQVITAAPGLGKTRAVSELGAPTTLGDELNLAWVAQNRAMRAEGMLGLWRHIEPPDGPHWCPNWRLHQALGEQGYNTHAAHAAHHETFGRCAYEQQFDARRAAVYQLAHVSTTHPARHDGVVIDELDIAAWLPSRQVTLRALQRATAGTADSSAGLLLRGLRSLLVDAQTTNQTNQTKQALHGRALFDALDAMMGGRLAETLAAINQQPPDLRPWFTLRDGETPEDAAARVLAGPDTTYQRVALALMAELPHWRAGGAWNSLLTLEPAADRAHAGEWALAITERLAFIAEDGKPLPPITLLDATADAELLARLFGRPVRLEPAEAPAPPPHTRHIAVRSGKRYGKRALTGWGAKGLDVAAREVAYLLNEHDPDGDKRRAGKVGLVTFAGAEAELAKRLGVPYDPDGAGLHRTLHFWAARGSNALETCEIVVIVGTPTLPEHELYRMARALWVSDTPIVEGASKAAGGRLAYTDARVQRLADYLIDSELAQCAHRIRPLRHDGRVVISFAVAGDLAYLPATTTIASLPRLTASAEDRAQAKARQDERRLAAAYARLVNSGARITRHTLAAEASVRGVTAGDWLRVYRAAEALQSQTTSDLMHSADRCPTSLIESYKRSGTPNEYTPPPRLDGTSWLASDEIRAPPPNARALYPPMNGSGA